MFSGQQSRSATRLSALTTDAAGELDVLGHDGHALGVDDNLSLDAIFNPLLAMGKIVPLRAAHGDHNGMPPGCSGITLFELSRGTHYNENVASGWFSAYCS